VLDVELVKFYTAEMINILEYMHNKGICHRDLKPSNFLFDENYHLKIVNIIPNLIRINYRLILVLLRSKLKNKSSLGQGPSLFVLKCNLTPSNQIMLWEQRAMIFN
jgi:serine/threonine protein kinase